jgi:hypothetical protein
MKTRMNVPPRVLGKVQFREPGEGDAEAVMGRQGRKNGNAAARHIAYAHVANAHVAKLHCSRCC